MPGFLAGGYESHKYCPDAGVENRGSYRDETVDDDERSVSKGKGVPEGDR